MQRLEVSGAVRPVYGSLGLKRSSHNTVLHVSLGVNHHQALLVATIKRKISVQFTHNFKL